MFTVFMSVVSVVTNMGAEEIVVTSELANKEADNKKMTLDTTLFS